MPLTRRLRHSAPWVLMLWAFVLMVGVLSPAFHAEAARSMDSVCMAPDVSGAVPDADSAAHHASLQCPLCWSATAAPPVVMHGPAADPLPHVRPLAEAPCALHALVACFEPARGPPRA